MSVNDRLVELITKQIELEKRTLEDLIKAEEEAKETAVRLAFMELRLDTWKHQKFLEGMLEMLKQTPCDEWSAKVARYSGRVKLERWFNGFIQSQREMADILGETLKEVDDPLAKHLLEHLKEDEEGHYEDLKKMVTLIKMAPLQSKKGEKGTDIVCDN